MTIEEIIENTVGQKLYFHDIGINECIKLCQEVRRLTIEECKKKATIGLYQDWQEQGKSYSLVSEYSFNDYIEVSIDYDSFPTDLNSIDI